jgi:hypothetical protein
VIARLPRRLRWWLAVLFADWAHSLTKPESGDEPVWLTELGIEYIRRNSNAE